MNQKPLTDAFIEKTIMEVRNNIARRERISFGNGILWTVILTWLIMIMVYVSGNTPNPGSMVGLFMCGLWFRYKNEH